MGWGKIIQGKITKIIQGKTTKIIQAKTTKRYKLEWTGHIFDFLLLPVYATEADGEFGSVCSVMRNTLTAFAVTRTVFRTRTLNIVMWTRHGGLAI